MLIFKAKSYYFWIVVIFCIALIVLFNYVWSILDVRMKDSTILSPPINHFYWINGIGIFILIGMFVISDPVEEVTLSHEGIKVKVWNQIRMYPASKIQKATNEGFLFGLKIHFKFHSKFYLGLKESDIQKCVEFINHEMKKD